MSCGRLCSSYGKARGKSLKELLVIDFKGALKRIGAKSWAEAMYLGGLRDAHTAQDMLRNKEFYPGKGREYLIHVIEHGMSALEHYKRERPELFPDG